MLCAHTPYPYHHPCPPILPTKLSTFLALSPQSNTYHVLKLLSSCACAHGLEHCRQVRLADGAAVVAVDQLKGSTNSFKVTFARGSGYKGAGARMIKEQQVLGAK